MDKFVINGGKRLLGQVRISGSKNAALPIMAAAILADGQSVISGVPDLADVRHMCDLLGDLGAEVRRDEQGRVHIDPAGVEKGEGHAEYDRVRKMRASVCVLGPLLARRGSARVSMPGGCAIGARPIDLHLRGLGALGANIKLDQGDIVASCNRLRGAEMFLGGPFGSTVLGTANVIMAATRAEGTTVIESAACEPEVADLAAFLNAMGAKIRGAGTPKVVVEGVNHLEGTEHHVIPDRIEAGTFMMAAAMTNGQLNIKGIRMDHMMAVVDKLRQVGITVESDDGGLPTGDKQAGVQVASLRRLNPADVTTQPYPGFPTDLQAQLTALLCLAEGNSVITEKIFPDRFLHVAELLRMGANIRKEGPTSIVTGVKHLIGAPVMASDLRASAALVLAGLVAKGETTISRVYHIDRGYERIESKLVPLGADISRIGE